MINLIRRFKSKKTVSEIEYWAGDLWTTIEEMPYWNWDKIYETGDLKYLFKSCEGVVTKRLEDVWSDLQQQHMDEFGTEDSLRTRTRTIKKLNDLNLEYIETGDRHLLNLINIQESKLQEHKDNHFSMYKVLDVITTHKGFDIDPKKYTVIKWFYTLKNMSKQDGTSN